MNGLQVWISRSLVLVALLVASFCPRLMAGWSDLRRAEQATGAGRYEEAAASFASAAERWLGRDRLWERAGISALAGKDPAYAVLLFERAGQLSPQGQFMLGVAYEGSGDLDQALSIWQDLADGGFLNPEIYIRLASAYRAQQDFEAAIEALRSALEFAPDNQEAQILLGLLIAATNPAEALPEVARVLNMDQETGTALRPLYEVLLDASAVDDQAFQLVSSGRALAALGEWDLAAEAFHRAVMIRKEYAEAWAWLGESFQQQGKDGHYALEQAVRLDPNSALCQALYGLYCFRLGQSGPAVSAFLEAVNLEPGNAAWQIMLAQAWRESGNLNQALDYYQQATQSAPGELSYWQSLVDFCVDYNLEIGSVALPAANRMLALAPEDWRSLDAKGQVLLLLGNIPAAEDHLLRAVDADGEQAAPHLHLGQLLLRIGNRVSAYDHLRRAQDLDPSGRVGWQADRLLRQYFP